MRNVVITGGSRGIGAAAVELFAARGDRVTFLYEKNHAAAAAVAAGLVKKGDIVVLTAGLPLGKAGTTNMLRVVEV